MDDGAPFEFTIKRGKDGTYSAVRVDNGQVAYSYQSISEISRNVGQSISEIQEAANSGSRLYLNGNPRKNQWTGKPIEKY